MEFNILGPLEVLRDGHPVSLGRFKERALLALLLINANRVVATDRIIDELWGEEGSAEKQNALWVNVSNLRSALEPERPSRTEGSVLLTRAPGYLLQVEPEGFDAARFEQLAHEGRALRDTDPEAAALVLGEALAMWRGQPLEEFTYEQFAQTEIARLAEVRLATVEDRISADLQRGLSGELVGELEALVRHHPLREGLTEHLMLALYRSGRQAEALRAYQMLSSRLGDELGIEPSRKLRELEEQMVLTHPALDRPITTAGLGGVTRTGLTVRGYELREQIGEGSFGVAFRAYQPAVGREVAVKVIRPELANNPDFIRRFEAEAKLVAGLEHPHIVPLYDYWREPDAAFLVMRLMGGGNLQTRLEAGAVDLDLAARVVTQVGGALAAAHRQSIVHRDLKPANIHLDDRNDAYLGDFGIAVAPGEAITAEGLPASTLGPPYAAPEQLSHHGTTPASDIYSLAVITAQLLSGRTGDIAKAEQMLDPDVADVIHRATDPDPSRRFRDVASFGNALEEALAGQEGRPATTTLVATDVKNPYKGLRAFDQIDAADFFGRDRLVDRLVARLGHPGSSGRFVAVVGPSGSGKSSVVKAGVLPALSADAILGSAGWFSIDLTPGPHPFEAVEKALLRIAVDPPRTLLEELTRDELGIARSVRRVLPDEQSQLLIFIDQFEELFTQANEATTRRFLDSLTAAVNEKHSRIRLLLTLRADYYDRPLGHRGFGELLREGTELITPMTPAEVERAITGPAERIDIRFEPALVAEIVRDVADRSSSLPLLQYTLRELFEHRTGSTIALRDYEKVGGVSGALIARAEGIYHSLDETARAAARQVFLRLVSLNEGAEPVRRRALLSEVTGLTESAREVGTVIDDFGRHRLLSFDRDPVGRSPTVEVAHEALLNEWPRLREWIDGSRTDILLRRRLSTAMAEWSDADRDPGFLLTGGRLAQLQEWAATTDLVLTRDEEEYFEASVLRSRAEEQRKARRRRMIFTGLSTATIVAVALASFALIQRDSAQENARLARAGELAGAAVANLDRDPQRSILLALEAARVTQEAGEGVTRETEEALHQAILASRLELVITPDAGLGRPVAAVFSPDGSRLAVSFGSGEVQILGATTGKLILRLEGHENNTFDVKWNSDGTRLLTVSTDGTARLWDPQSGAQLRLYGPIDAGMGIGSFSPDDKRIATSNFFPGAAIRVWDTASGTELLEVLTDPSTWPVGVAFDPVSGDRIAVALEPAAEFGAGVLIVDSENGDEILRIPATDGVCELRWSPDGTKIATASRFTSVGAAQVLDAETGEQLASFEGHHSPVCTVDFSPNGTLVATGGEDGAARIWEAETGKEVLSLEGHDERVSYVEFSPDGSRLVTSSDDDRIRVWDITPEGRRELVAVSDGSIMPRAAYTPDGTNLVTASFSGAAVSWSAVTGEPATLFLGHQHRIHSLDVSHDGTRIVTTGRDSTVRMWDVATGTELHRLDLPWPGRGVAFSPDDRLVIVGGTSSLVLWDVATNEQTELENAPSGFFGALFHAVEFSPDGSTIAVGGDTGIHFWDVNEELWLEPIVFTEELSKDVTTVEFNGDGTMLLSAHVDGARLWDLSSGELIRTFEGHRAPIWDATFNTEQTLVATASHDGTVRLWDLTNGEEVLLLEDDQQFDSVSFSPDGKHLLVSGDFGARIYVIDENELIELAHARLLRWWTPDECFQFLGSQVCPPSPNG